MKLKIRSINSQNTSIDKLGFFSIVIHLYYSVAWSVSYYSGPILFIKELFIPQAILSLSLLGFLNPKNNLLLLINSILFATIYIYRSPISSNNQTTAFFLSILIILSILKILISHRSISFDRNKIFHLIQAPGKLILVFMYFFGIYHKLNTDFFNPNVSCAVELSRSISSIIGQGNNTSLNWIPIYLTLFVETIAIISLLFQRYRKFGLAVTIPFHIIIGFTGYAFYMDFSTIVLAMYSLNINDDSLERMKAFYDNRFRPYWLRKTASLLPVGLALTIFIYVTMICQGICSYRGFMPIFAVYSIPISLILLFSRNVKREERKKSKSGLLFLIPIMFFLNGLSPYLGLKTESSLSMYSNLYVEGRTTNHFLHGVLPGFWNYSDEVITVLDSNNQKLKEEKSFVRYDFDRRLSNLKNIEVTVQSNQKNSPQKISTSDSNWKNTYDETNWLMKKYLIFKSIDNTRPKSCDH